MEKINSHSVLGPRLLTEAGQACRLAAAPSKCFRRYYRPVIWHGKRTKMIALSENTIWFSIPSSLIYWRSPHKILLSPSQVNSLELPPFFPVELQLKASELPIFPTKQLHSPSLWWTFHVGEAKSDAEEDTGRRRQRRNLGSGVHFYWWFDGLKLILGWTVLAVLKLMFYRFSHLFWNVGFGWLWLLGLNQPRMG